MWRIKIKIKVPEGHSFRYEWRDMKPSRLSLPYEWKTKKEADQMRQMCYPEQTEEEVKVYQVK